MSRLQRRQGQAASPETHRRATGKPHLPCCPQRLPGTSAPGPSTPLPPRRRLARWPGQAAYCRAIARKAAGPTPARPAGRTGIEDRGSRIEDRESRIAWPYPLLAAWNCPWQPRPGRRGARARGKERLPRRPESSPFSRPPRAHVAAPGAAKGHHQRAQHGQPRGQERHAQRWPAAGFQVPETKPIHLVGVEANLQDKHSDKAESGSQLDPEIAHGEGSAANPAARPTTSSSATGCCRAKESASRTSRSASPEKSDFGPGEAWQCRH